MLFIFQRNEEGDNPLRCVPIRFSAQRGGIALPVALFIFQRNEEGYPSPLHPCSFVDTTRRDVPPRCVVIPLLNATRRDTPSRCVLVPDLLREGPKHTVRPNFSAHLYTNQLSTLQLSPSLHDTPNSRTSDTHCHWNSMNTKRTPILGVFFCVQLPL